MNTKNILIGMSGGPTPVINATLAAIIDAAKKSAKILTLYGMKGGILGAINDDVCCLYDRKFARIDDDRPGAILGTCRHKLVDGDCEKILETLKRHSINCVMLIGGNDTMDTANRLNDFLKKEKYPCSVLGIPKTVDNDLMIDHSPGFISAAKYVKECVERIIYDHKSFYEGGVTIIETMGRNAGWLTAAAYLAEGEAYPDLVYLPEVPVSLEQILLAAYAIYKNRGYCAVVISEGVRDSSGNLIDSSTVKDSFGHTQLGGIAELVGNAFSNRYPGIKVRTERLGTMQRACEPDPYDLYEAQKLGENAIYAAKKGYSGIMISVDAGEWQDLSMVANQEKVIPREWIDDRSLLLKYLIYTTNHD